MNLIRNAVFWLIILTIITFLFLPNFVRDGMFVDGLYYAAISNNMAHSIGSIWAPRFSETIYYEFYEHPPLIFGIQSLFFKVLGSGYYVERLYSFIVLVITLLLIDRLWKQIHRDRQELYGLSYIPVLLLILNEDVYHSYTNNMLECSMGLFILGAVSMMISSIDSAGIKGKLYIIGSGLMIVLAFMSKGPTGLFPLVFFILFRLFFSDFTWRGALSSSLILFISVGCFFIIIFLFEGARNNILHYLDVQVLSSLQGGRAENIQTSHFHIIKSFFEKSLVPIVLTGAILLLLRFKKILLLHKFDKAWVLFFLGFGMSGSLPIMISVKQASFYLIPSLPFYCIALGLLISGGVSVMSKNFTPVSIPYKVSLAVTMALFAIASLYTVNQVGKIDKRDRDLLEDIHLMGQLIPEHTVVDIMKSKIDYSMYGYLQRYYYISCDTRGKCYRNYLIIDKSLDTIVRQDYVRLAVSAKHFNLYQKRTLFDSQVIRTR